MLSERPLSIIWQQGSDKDTLIADHVLEETAQGKLLRRFLLVDLSKNRAGFITAGVVEKEEQVLIGAEGHLTSVGNPQRTREMLAVYPPINPQFTDMTEENNARRKVGLAPVNRTLRI